MLPRLKFLGRLYLAFVLVFFAAKSVFFLFNGPAAHDASWADLPAILWHGLPLDLSTAGYLAALPWLLLLAATWLRLPALRTILKAYAACLALLLSLIFLADTCLYAFWDFKLDGTVFNYLDSPAGALQSVSPAYAATACAAFAATAALLFFVFARQVPRAGSPVLQPAGSRRQAAGTTLLLLAAGGLLFLAIRGGTGRSTANVGMVYYSQNQYLNHSAVNPAFSIFYSLRKAEDYASKGEFFEESRRAEIFASLQYDTTSVATDTLLTTRRPNVLIILMEGCGATFVEAVGGKPGVTPHLNRLAREGVLFSRCYANSFRTDRGTLCTLSGYPSFPDLSVMKLPAISRTLPSIARTLQGAGYATEFLYGGDKNFTNMNSYLMATDYARTYGDTDFPAETRRTHAWGVTDSITFDRLLEMIAAYPAGRPWHTAFLTLASHEPWKVPYHRIEDDEKANAMAYLDSCIGRFVEALKQTPAWANTLIVLLPDHGIRYPEGLGADNPRRCHIPMIWTGGAVRAPRTVDRICNQTDLAATLLGQMGLPHADFRFSRDVLSRTYRYPCAVHTWSGGLSFIDSTGYSALDLASGRVLSEQPAASESRRQKAKAFLQTCYDDLGSR